jgi:integrase
MMAHTDKRIAPNIYEDSRRPGKLYVRVYSHGRVFIRRAANISHARQLLHEIKVAATRGESLDKPNHRPALFDHLLEAYRSEKQREGKAVMHGEFGWRNLLGQWGRRSVESISTREVKAWRDNLLDKYSAASVNRHLVLFRAILRMAVRDRKIKSDVLPEIELLDEHNGRVRYLQDDEEPRLLEALPEWLRPLVICAIHTGLRKGELLELKWDEVDLVAGAITLRKTKSGEVERIPVNQTVRALLSDVRIQRIRHAKASADARALFGRYVFCAPGGGKLMNLNRYWYPALRAAGIEDLHFHDLRHTFCSRLMMECHDPYRVQKLARHRSFAMTQRYSHVSNDLLREAVEMLDGRKPRALP